MAAAVLPENSENDTLELLLYKATNPLNHAEDWESIVGFCNQVNKELEGPQTAIRLLVHKIQSPHEKESLLALTTTEACVKNCGKRFQQEIGKFRFLNEIIKVVSPKYLGNHTSEKVKKKCVDMLFHWSEVLSHEPKIREAYQMLKRQGIVKQDPVISDPIPPPPSPPPRPKNTIFDDDEKSKTLSRLLRSRNPDDLQAANRLIKTMVKQDAERLEKVSRRTQQLETVNNNVKLLSDMLSNHEPTNSSESDREIMKELYQNLEKERPNLFKLASDTDERDEAGIGDILKSNDEVIKVMTLYEEKIKDTETTVTPEQPPTYKESFMKDLECLNTSEEQHQQAAGLTAAQLSASLRGQQQQAAAGSNSGSFIDDQLLSLGIHSSGGPDTGLAVNGSVKQPSGRANEELDDLFGSVSTSSTQNNDLLLTSSVSPFPVPTATRPAISTVRPAGIRPPAPGGEPAGVLQPTMLSTNQNKVGGANKMSDSPAGAATSVNWFTDANGQTQGSSSVSHQHKQPISSAGFESIDALSKTLLEQNRSTTSATEWKQYKPAAQTQKLSLNELSRAPAAPSSQPIATGVGSAANSAVLTPSSSSGDVALLADEPVEVKPLDDIHVPLETIQPGGIESRVVYDKNNIKIVFHFGKDRPRPDVQVVAISVTSTSPHPLKDFLFQASTAKILKVKLQPASGSDLPAYNPILPPSAITQVMLVALPPQEMLRLKFKISYNTKGGDIMTDIGELDPPVTL